MLVEAIMTTPVLSVRPDASIDEAIKVMLAHGVSGLPVVTADGRPVGIVTESDFLQRHELATEHKRPRWLSFLLGPGQSAEDYIKTRARIVNEVMTEELVTIAPKAELIEAVELMQSKSLRRILVLDGSGKVIGILSRADLLRGLTTMAKTEPPLGNDDAIAAAVKTELAKQSWTGRDLIRVSVSQGVVTLKGMILDERARMAAKVAAENVSGVKSVVDELIWVEPMSGTVILPSGGYISPGRPGLM